MLVILFWVGSGLLGACAPTPLPQSPLAPPAAWEIRLTQSGGIAAFWLSLEVSSDGRLLAEDRRLGRSVQENLPAETLVQLSQLIAATRIPSVAATPTGCMDCFLYDLEIRFDGTVSRLSVDDVSLEASGAASLIHFLLQLRDGALRRAP